MVSRSWDIMVVIWLVVSSGNEQRWLHHSERGSLRQRSWPGASIRDATLFLDRQTHSLTAGSLREPEDEELLRRTGEKPGCCWAACWAGGGTAAATSPASASIADKGLSVQAPPRGEGSELLFHKGLVTVPPAGPDPAAAKRAAPPCSLPWLNCLPRLRLPPPPLTALWGLLRLRLGVPLPLPPPPPPPPPPPMPPMGCV